MVAVEGGPLADINVAINNVRWAIKARAVVSDKTKGQVRIAEGPTLSRTKDERVGHPRILSRVDLAPPAEFLETFCDQKTLTVWQRRFKRKKGEKKVFIEKVEARGVFGERARPGGSLLRKTMACVSAMTLASLMLLPAAASAQEREEGGDGRLLRAGNGPGPAANGPGPGCNIIPPLASIGTKVDISQFPPPDSLTNPALAGPVQLLKSGKFDIPIEQLTSINVPAGNPRGTVTLPLYKGAVNTPSGLKPAWYIILDAGDQAEAERLGVNFSKKLHNAGDAARTATRRDDGTFLFDSGLVDFRPNREVVAGSQEKPFPPSVAQPGSVGDEDYSPLVLVDGIIYDAPVVAAAVDDAFINFPNGNPNYGLVHDQVVAIDPAKRTVTLSLINGYSFGKPVFYISTESSDPTVSAIEGNTFAPRLRRIETGVDDISRSAVERIFIATNGETKGGCQNPQRQGLGAALLDGHRPNNTFGGIPTTATDYSPVWDANVYEWTEEAIEKGYRGLLTEEFRILKLARDGYITGPNGAPYGSFGPVIVCGVAARLN